MDRITFVLFIRFLYSCACCWMVNFGSWLLINASIQFLMKKRSQKKRATHKMYAIHVEYVRKEFLKSYKQSLSFSIMLCSFYAYFTSVNWMQFHYDLYRFMASSNMHSHMRIVYIPWNIHRDGIETVNNWYCELKRLISVIRNVLFDIKENDIFHKQYCWFDYISHACWHSSPFFWLFIYALLTNENISGELCANLSVRSLFFFCFLCGVGNVNTIFADDFHQVLFDRPFCTHIARKQLIMFT